MRTDSRPIKTKKSIKQALLILLKEKDMSSITISELAVAASVSRKTFYLHYKDISDILDEINLVITILTSMFFAFIASL